MHRTIHDLYLACQCINDEKVPAFAPNFEAVAAKKKPKPPLSDFERKRLLRLGSAVRDARKQRGLSQAELAQRVNCDPQTISNLELGKQGPGFLLVAAIADLFRIELAQLTGDATLDADPIEEADALVDFRLRGIEVWMDSTKPKLAGLSQSAENVVGEIQKIEKRVKSLEAAQPPKRERRA